ncbi:hypothetical protein PB2503_04057 [Parvularcula bermudensis HTCC2503]|uniref:Glycosyltransferase 2-like domain-containing protein n=1 Tax=Parvularcula bermudensis (strain ATCC BAA-594 / HTCC2503 / KCTC 12087) TaxID=314260 RepID=E0TE65_PARBH|nr:hypothetical protein PB2503_04057 [Parvularcula bermudensis HTCC2503]
MATTAVSPVEETLRHLHEDASIRTRSAADLERLRRRAGGALADAARDFLWQKDPTASARLGITPSQRNSFVLLAALLFVAAIIGPLQKLIALNLGVTLFYLFQAGLRSAVLSLSLAQPRRLTLPPPPIAPEERLPPFTILCPVYDEAESLPHLVGSLLLLDYPRERLDIKIILEADDRATIAAARTHCRAPMFDLVLVPPSAPRTKPKALNHALWTAKGDYIVIYDAEDRPAPDQLTLAARTFAALPDHIACLQCRLNYYNRDTTILTRLFALEYALLFDMTLPGLAALSAPVPLGGTSNILRTDILMAVGGWDPFNVTEDADLGLRLHRAGYETRLLNSTTLEEATDETGAWLRQRTRWMKGFMQTWLVHSRRAPRTGRFGHFLTVHGVVGGTVLAALINPVAWAIYGAWILGVDGIARLFPTPLNVLALTAFLGGNLLHLYMMMIAPLRRRWHDLVPYAVLSPLYWILQSVAAYRALWQLIRRPSYWEKTKHGRGLSPEETLRWHSTLRQ